MHAGGTYRPDIDGLRAVAVVAVTIFHVNAALLPGGFVGVDVFFVISGYLITGIVRRASEIPNFDTWAFLRSFYMKRIRRLLPALFVTVLASLIAATILFSPDHLEQFAGSAIAAVFSISNILFWSEAGYWDASKYTKPLLHSWSLAVEEQFYLVWPAFILLSIMPAVRRFAPAIIILVSAISLVFAEFWLRKDASAVFYLTPFRVAEFGVGALLTWLPTIFRGRSADSACTIGLALIIGCAVLYSDELPFPGLTAMVPCLGAALVIMSSDQSRIGSVLQVRPAVWIGKLSYSLYLTHWPVIVFWRYSTLREPTIPDQIGMVVLSMILATLLYYLIERHFRWRQGKHHPSPRQAIAFTAAVALLVVVPSSHAWNSSGWEWRIGNELRQLSAQAGKAGLRERDKHIRIACHLSDQTGPTFSDFENALGRCNPIEPGTIVVMGDSTAADLYMALSSALPDHNIIQFTGAACSALADGRCARLMEHAVEVISQNRDEIAHVAYTQRGRVFGRDGKVNAHLIERTRDFLSQVSELDVDTIWVGPSMEYHPGISTLIAQSLSVPGFIELSNAQQLEDIFVADRAIAERLNGTAIRYSSKIQNLCPNSICPLIDQHGSLFVADYVHWTYEGALAFGPKLASDILASDHPSAAKSASRDGQR